MSPEITAMEIGGVLVSVSFVGALGSMMADKVSKIMIQRWEDSIVDKARKIPRIIITSPTVPHYLDFS